MTRIERCIELDVPASVAYEAWSDFERFPEFMAGIDSVEPIADGSLRWRASIGGREEEWVAEITEQIPDHRIAWRSTQGLRTAGVVTFHRISDDRSRVMLQLGYELESLSERIGDALGFLSGTVQGDLERFKQFAEDDVPRGGLPPRGSVLCQGDPGAPSFL